MEKWVEGGPSQEVNGGLYRQGAVGHGDYSACLLPDLLLQQLLSIFSGHASSCSGVSPASADDYS